MLHLKADSKYFQLEVQGPSGPQLLVCGPSGLFDFVLRALWALRPCDPCNDAVIGQCCFVDNPKDFVNKSKKICQQIKRKLSKNPKNFIKKFRRQIKKYTPKAQKTRKSGTFRKNTLWINTLWINTLKNKYTFGNTHCR